MAFQNISSSRSLWNKVSLPDFSRFSLSLNFHFILLNWNTFQTTFHVTYCWIISLKVYIASTTWLEDLPSLQAFLPKLWCKDWIGNQQKKVLSNFLTDSGQRLRFYCWKILVFLDLAYVRTSFRQGKWFCSLLELKFSNWGMVLDLPR